jgi:type III secretion protein L
MPEAEPVSPDIEFEERLRPFLRAPAGPVLQAGDFQAWSDAQEYLAAAKKVLQEADQKAAELAAAGQAKGYAAGWEEGSKAIFDLVAQTKREIDAYYAQLETTLRELAIQVIREIIGGLDASDAVASAVRKALERPDFGTEVTLYVSPEVFPAVKQKLEGQLGHATISSIILREDPGLSPAGCILTSEFCKVDISLEKQLELLAASLRTAQIGART